MNNENQKIPERSDGKDIVAIINAFKEDLIAKTSTINARLIDAFKAGTAKGDYIIMGNDPHSTDNEYIAMVLSQSSKDATQYFAEAYNEHARLMSNLYLEFLGKLLQLCGNCGVFNEPTKFTVSAPSFEAPLSCEDLQKYIKHDNSRISKVY